MINSENHKSKAVLSLLAGVMLMGFSAIFIKSANAPGIVTAWYRMTIGAVILSIPFIVSQINPVKPLNIKGVKLAVLAGACFGLDMALWASGVVLSNATLPTLFANLAPIWVGLGAMIFFKERSRKGFWVGVAVAIIGFILLSAKGLNGSNRLVMGIFLGGLAGLFYSIFYLFAQNGRKLLDTISFHFISTASASVFLTILMLSFRYDFIGYDHHSYLMFLGIGVGVQVFGWLCITYTQGHMPARIIAPTVLAQPVITAILAFFLLDEQLTILHKLGGAVIIAGIYIVHITRNKD